MKTLDTNKKAFHNYFSEDKFEAGIVLTGDEIKSVRAGHFSIVDTYGYIKNEEGTILTLNIAFVKCERYRQIFCCILKQKSV